jgi:O-acetyl-ADP-ribose deacetylase (regulator of RNase III)
MIKVINEDIFNYDPQEYDTNNPLLLVDPINCNLNVMGKGLALAFKQKYPKEFKKEKLKDIDVGIGNVNMLNTEHSGVNIILFPTKIHWSNPSEYWYISASLTSLRAWIWNWVCDKETYYDGDEMHFTIRMPKIGCGLGGLDFKKVLDIIKVIFDDDFCEMCNVTILVCDNG